MTRRKIAAPAGARIRRSRGRNAAPKWAPSTPHDRNDKQATIHLGFGINQVYVEVPINDDVFSYNNGLLSVHCGTMTQL
jgi:hypothetical protein